jgi:hypothetical protein
MKKLVLIVIIAGTLVACNNAGESTSTANKKDSLDSIANQKKDVIDSSSEAKKDKIDSTTARKKDSLDRLDSMHAKHNKDTSKSKY